MDHVAKGDAHKILPECKLPLTGARCVSHIITDLVGLILFPINRSSCAPKAGSQLAPAQQCVFDVNRKEGGLTLTELAPGVTLEEVKAKTGAPFKVADNLKQMDA